MSTMTQLPGRPAETPQRPRPSGSRVAAIGVLVVLACAGVWSINALEMNLGTIVNSADNAVAFFDRMFPLDFPPLGETLSLIFETLAIVFLATLLSVILSIPLSLAAARPTSQGKASQGDCPRTDRARPCDSGPSPGHHIFAHVWAGRYRRYHRHGHPFGRHGRQALRRRDRRTGRWPPRVYRICR